VWLAPGELRALGNLPWRLDPQLPHLDRIADPLGPLAVRADPPSGAVAAAPEQWCEAVAAVERIRAGEPVTFPVGGDLRFVLVWLAVVALDLPDIALCISHREAVFTPPPPVAPVVRFDPPAGPGVSRWSRFTLAVAVGLGLVIASVAAARLFARLVLPIPTIGPIGVE
jgi:hypothetical protein